MTDLLATTPTARIHEHGSVALVDVMPRLVPEGQTADHAIADAARVSYAKGTKRTSDDRTLIRYLMRHRHSGPFEFVETKWVVKAPLFVARQWLRTRTASVNEVSARYSVLPSDFYRPAVVRAQASDNKQGSEGEISNDIAGEFTDYLDNAEALHEEYLWLERAGVSRELARIGLPASVYTEWTWKIDLHNLLRFLSLRMDSHAQQEIRDYATAMYAMLRPLCPHACEAFDDYELGAVRLTRLELDALRSGQPIATTNKREAAEWDAKRERMGGR